MKNKVLSSIKKYNMLRYGDNVYIGVSGGADSMCLLNVLYELKDELNLKLNAVHINHLIRGDEAFRDEIFVKSFCEEKGIYFICEHIDVPLIHKTSSESLEECARRLRYDFFDKISENGKFATAHNLNDSIETYFLNTIRGTGLKGLTGIPPVRGKFIRPLIEVSRDEIEEYCKINDIDFVTDSTNLCDDYSRNKIRHNVIPVCKEINSSFLSVFGRNSDLLKTDLDYIDAQVENRYNVICSDKRLSCEKLSVLHNSIKYRIISRYIYNNCGIYPEFKHICLIDSFLTVGGALNISDNIVIKSDGLYLKIKEVHNKKNNFEISIKNDKIKYYFNDFILELKIVNIDAVKNNKNIRKLSLEYYCDYDKILNGIIRNRKNGDKFKKPFSAYESKLKNIFNEYGIKDDRREDSFVISNNANILFVYNIGVSDYAKIDNNTKKICKITVWRNSNA